MVETDFGAAIIDAVASLVMVVDGDGRIVRWNRACEIATGLPRSVVVGRIACQTVAAPDETEAFRSTLAEAMTGGPAREIQCHFPSATREARHIRWSIVRATAGADQEQCLVATGTEVSPGQVQAREPWEQQAWYRHIVESAHEGVSIVDPDGKLIYVNRRLAEMLGYEPDDLIGRPFYEEVDLPLRDELLARLKRRFEGVRESYELRLRHRDGSAVWVLVNTNPLQDESGKYVASLGMVTDITDRKRAEDDLRESEERFRVVVENSPDLIFYMDDAFRFTWISRVNPHTRLVNAVGKTDIDVVGARDAAPIREVVERVKLTGIVERVETTAHIDGLDYHYETALTRRLDRDGHVIGIAGYVRDVTERKRAEQELQALNETLEQRVLERTASLEARTQQLLQSEQALRSRTELLNLILDHMGDGVAVADENGRFLLFNPAAERIIGGRPKEMPPEGWSQHFGFFLPDQQTPYPDRQLPLQRALRGESVNDTEIFVRHSGSPDGKWISVTSRTIRNSQGAIAGGVTVIRDLTERKHAEQALRFSEQRFRLLVEQAPVSIHIMAPDGRTVQVNRAFERTFGVTIQQLESYNILHDPQIQQLGVKPLLERIFAGDLALIPAVRYVPAIGAMRDRQRWLKAYAYAVKADDGSVREVVLVHEDITDQKRADDRLRESEQHYRDLAQHNRLLVDEVEHRVRNNLAALIGLVDIVRLRTRDVDTFAGAIEVRLRAMAHVHQLLMKGHWQPVNLGALVISALDAMKNLASSDTPEAAEGPDIAIPPHQALPLTMILLEWYTNSCKYGVHSATGGSLRVQWNVIPFDGGKGVRLTWEEIGGPPPGQSHAPSLGTELVHAFATRELRGACSMQFPPEGARHRIEFPLVDEAPPQAS